MLDQEKLQKYAKRIHENACKHGWHETRLSDQHFLAMIMTEVSEAIEADRLHNRADMQAYSDYKGLNNDAYQNFIKGSVEEEFADICIRILDFAYEKYGEDMRWHGYDINVPHYQTTFTEQAWLFVKEILSSGFMNISTAIVYMAGWADLLGIDLDFHIQLKMQYNEKRQYKHGGKAY